jgi:LmbE family N-acetylglucosaminyl deacetylase
MRWLALALLLCAVTFSLCAAEPPSGVLIVAPHPDDEVIGCAGVIQRALKGGQKVTIIFLTNGDAHAKIAALLAKKSPAQLVPGDFLRTGALRQQHALNAATKLGLPRENLFFLGYPDGGLAPIYQAAAGSIFTSPVTAKAESSGQAVPDYHSRIHGTPAPCTRENILRDLAEIIRARGPAEIYTTHETDRHPDHQAAFWYTRAAAAAAGFTGPLYTFIVHGAPPAAPPDRRLTLDPSELALKKEAIMAHQQGTSPVHDYLVEEYGKPEEHFWRAPGP